MEPLHLSKLPLESIIDNLPAPIIITDHAGTINFINKKALLLYGYNEQNKPPKDIFDLAASLDEKDYFKSILSFSIQLAEPSGRFLGKHRNCRGETLDVDVQWTLVISTTNVSVVFCIDDITDLKQIEKENLDKFRLLEAEIEQRKKIEKTLQETHEELREKIAALETQKTINDTMLSELAANNEALERLAIQDSLTGIYNRRYFTDSLESEIIRARHLKEPLSLILIDLDHFKKINDTLGHLVGDKVLINVAKKVQDIIGAGNILCRYGGEEFGIISLGSNLTRAEGIAHKISDNLADHPICVNNHKVLVTASIGVSSIAPSRWKAPLEAIRDYLIKTADKALYKAKAAGRNKVELYNRAIENSD